MLNKIVEAMLIMMVIGSFISIVVMLYCAIRIVICDYEMWKRKKAEKDRCRQIEDKFKNRKLTE